MSSGPAALSTFKFDNNFKIPFAFISMSTIEGFRSRRVSAWLSSLDGRRGITGRVRGLRLILSTLKLFCDLYARMKTALCSRSLVGHTLSISLRKNGRRQPNLLTYPGQKTDTVCETSDHTHHILRQGLLSRHVFPCSSEINNYNHCCCFFFPHNAMRPMSANAKYIFCEGLATFQARLYLTHAPNDSQYALASETTRYRFGKS